MRCKSKQSASTRGKIRVREEVFIKCVFKLSEKSASKLLNLNPFLNYWPTRRPSTPLSFPPPLLPLPLCHFELQGWANS